MSASSAGAHLIPNSFVGAIGSLGAGLVVRRSHKYYWLNIFCACFGVIGCFLISTWNLGTSEWVSLNDGQRLTHEEADYKHHATGGCSGRTCRSLVSQWGPLPLWPSSRLLQMSGLSMSPLLPAVSIRASMSTKSKPNSWPDLLSLSILRVPYHRSSLRCSLVRSFNSSSTDWRTKEEDTGS